MTIAGLYRDIGDWRHVATGCTALVVIIFALLVWHQFVHSEEVRRITNQPNLTAIIQSQHLSIFGHIARMDDDADAKMILMVPPPENWKRPPGRPRIT